MRLAIVSAALVWTTVAQADGVSTDAATAVAVPDRAAFVAVMEAHNCELPFAEAETVLRDAGFTPQNSNPIMEAMAAEGLLEIGPNEMILKSGNCH